MACWSENAALKYAKVKDSRAHFSHKDVTLTTANTELSYIHDFFGGGFKEKRIIIHWNSIGRTSYLNWERMNRKYSIILISGAVCTVSSISLSVYGVYRLSVGALLISLIFPLWLLWNEQASVVTYVSYRLAIPGNYLCNQQRASPSGWVKN